MEPTQASSADEVKAKLHSIAESYLRSATLSHLRDEVAVKQYIDHQVEGFVSAVMQSFKLEKK